MNAIVAKDEQDRIYMLDIIYDTHPGFGLDHFYEIVRHNVINITKKRTSDFLRKQLEYQLTVQPRKKKVRAKVYNNPNKAWGMDLIDMTNNIDKRKKYILTIIDLYDGKVKLRAIAHKTNTEVQAKLKAIFDVVKPRILISDNGLEFQLKQFYADNDVKFITTPSHTPQAHVENMNIKLERC